MAAQEDSFAVIDLSISLHSFSNIELRSQGCVSPLAREMTHARAHTRAHTHTHTHTLTQAHTHTHTHTDTDTRAHTQSLIHTNTHAPDHCLVFLGHVLRPQAICQATSSARNA